jgi:hypothetical protein
LKILTATSLTQGEQAGDYHWCHDGELVKPPSLICDRDTNDPNGGCGCGRGWTGLHSSKATTTAQVSSLPDFGMDDYATALSYSLEQWGGDKDDATALAQHLAEIADSYPIGTVFGHRLGELYIRAIPPTVVFID